MEHRAFTAALLEGVGTLWKADPYGVGRVTYKVTSGKADLIHQNFSSQDLGTRLFQENRFGLSESQKSLPINRLSSSKTLS